MNVRALAGVALAVTSTVLATSCGGGGDTTVRVSVAVIGSGSGVVTSTPSGVSCGTVCEASFDSGGTLVLNAAAEPGSVFAGWSGACTGTGAICTLGLNADAAVSAQFDVARHTVTAIVSGSGAGTVISAPVGITCPGVCVLEVDHGAPVILSATPAAGSSFLGWSGACSGAAPCVLNVIADAVAGATFGMNPSLLVTKAGAGTGTVTSIPGGIDCGTDCGEVYLPGQEVTLTATPTASSVFAGWSGGCTGTSACTLTLDAPSLVTATFTLSQYTLTVTRAGTGSGTVTSSPAGISCGADCTEPYDHGTSVTLSATPAAGSAFTGWSGGGCSGTGACTLAVTAATTVNAGFAPRGRLYTLRDTDNLWQWVDPDTRIISGIGTAGVTYAFGDCAWNPTTSTLFMVDGRGARALYRVSLSTGAATMVGVHGITDMFSLGYHPPSAFLYGIASDHNLYRLNPASGAATLIGATGVLESIDGLAWDSVRGRFVAITASLAGVSVYAINVSTGAATRLATGLPGLNNNGWTYDPVIDRFWVVDYNGGLYLYDPSTFARTTASTGLQAHTCVAYVP